jgi:hypothetical protein
MQTLAFVSLRSPKEFIYPLDFSPLPPPIFLFTSNRGGRCERLASWAPATIVVRTLTRKKERKGKERGGTIDKYRLLMNKIIKW